MGEQSNLFQLRMENESLRDEIAKLREEIKMLRALLEAKQ